VDIPVTPGELNQLLEPNLSGPSHKFMQDGLGILDLDGGKYVPSCNGEVPTRIAAYIQESNGAAGNILLADFGGPPHGYAPDMIKACLVGLLRAERIRIRPEQGPEITSVRDPGARDMFTKDRDLKRAEILPPGDGGLKPRDRVSICRFFEQSLQRPLDRENDAIADAVFEQFPGLVARLQELERRYNRLPNRPDLPDALVQLRQALEKCTRSRQVQDTVLAVFKALDPLREGIEMLGIMESELNDAAVEAVRRTVDVQRNQVKQLTEVEKTAEVQAEIDALAAQLALDRPWRQIAELEPNLQAIEEHYRALRTTYLDRQEKDAETVRQQLRQRQGFRQLTEQQEEKVLRPLREAVYNTSPEALFPSLLQLKDSAVVKLGQAAEAANGYLDDILSEVNQEEVVRLSLNLTGREVSSPEEVERLVEELKQRMLDQLKDKPNVRIRLI